MKSTYEIHGSVGIKLRLESTELSIHAICAMVMLFIGFGCSTEGGEEVPVPQLPLSQSEMLIQKDSQTSASRVATSSLQPPSSPRKLPIHSNR